MAEYASFKDSWKFRIKMIFGSKSQRFCITMKIVVREKKDNDDDKQSLVITEIVISDK